MADDLLEHLNSLSPDRRKLLARLLKKRGAATPETDENVPGRRPDAGARADGPLPLSFAQQRIWFVQQLEPDVPYYNMPFALRLRGRLDLAALGRALGEVVRRHEALRTVFVNVDGQPMQVVETAGPIRLNVIDLSGTPHAERDARARLEEEAARAFDLSRGPLLRTLVLRTGADEHVVSFTMHHIVSDGWSMGVLVRELTLLYDAYAHGRTAELPDPPFQYADYAIWQREWLQGEVLEGQLAYWKRQLEGAPKVLELPTDRPRPAQQSYDGAAVSFVVERPLAEALRELSRREDATLFMTLLAAWQTLLSRYSGQEDVCVGTPIAGRHRGRTDELIGLFINTLVLRANLPAGLPFAELLRRVRRSALEAYAHQDLPFEKLVEELQPERSLSYSPVFQVMFISQDTRPETLEFEGLSVSPLAVPVRTAQFDLTLAIQETGGGIGGSLEYSTALFDAETVERMAANFKTLLAGIIAEPARTLSTLPLLSDAERHHLLLSSEGPRVGYDRGLCIHQLFEERAACLREGRAALVLDGQQLTYAELNERANRLAHYLRELGVGPEALVGVMVERSAEMLTTLLAILKAGGAYVPLDPAYPQERIAFMVEHSGLSVLVSQQKLLRDLCAQSSRVRVVALDAERGAIAARPATNPRADISPDNLAYVLYTSGSTGRPKGVQITHGTVVNFLHGVRWQPGLAAHETLLAVTSISFDIAALELFLPLMVGARLVLADAETATDATRLQEQLEAQEVSVMQATPATWRMLLEAGWEGRPSLRILCGGEALPSAQAHALLRRGAEVWNLYGPTEATIWSSVKRLDPADSIITIGRPLANVRHYVLDTHLQPVPVGVAGELYIGGAGLARGYLGQPRATAQSFIPDHLSGEPGARLYRTGDSARCLACGEIEVLGRTDYQVKVRGFRIEPGEVEAALRSHEAVRDCVIIARAGQDGEQRLIAYVVAARPTAAEEWRRHLAAKLPAYMMPNSFVALDELPLTPNRKVDRKALPAPDAAAVEARAGFVAPRDLLELQLAKIWEEVLGLSTVGVRDNFFELGGHSLQAVRLVSRCRQLTGVELPLSALFRQPTIEHLASMLRGRSADVTCHSTLVQIQAGGTRPAFFCVHPSGGGVLCYAHLARQLGPEQPFYGFQSAGLDDEGALAESVEEMAARYVEELRGAQATGPYLLGGWSMGGLVALEMARQLRARGDEIALLALLDTTAPEKDAAPSVPDELTLMIHFALDLGVTHEALAELGGRVKLVNPDEQLAEVLELAKAADLVAPDVEPRVIRRLFNLFKANVRAMLNYRPPVWQGPLTLLVAEESEARAGDGGGARRWAEAARAVEVHSVPGSHFTMLREPHVRALAERLGECIERVGSPARRS